MIVLDTTTKSLEVILNGTVTANQLPIVASFVDVTATSYLPGATDTQTNSATAVTVVSAPITDTQRQVKLLTIYNADTAAAVVTLRYNDNGTVRIIIKASIAAGSTIVYTDGEGFRVIDSGGGIIGTGPTGATGATGPSGFGATGVDGIDGTDGIDGVSNIPGPAGATGAVGPMGMMGFDGADGSDGQQGATGAAGLNGTNGIVGPMGPPGDDGGGGGDDWPHPAQYYPPPMSGSWTPTITGNGGSSGQVYSVQSGRYHKIGPKVSVWGAITLSTLGTVTGQVLIGGLPFPHAGFQSIGVDIGIWVALTTAVVAIKGEMGPGVSAAALYKITAAVTGVGSMAQADLSATSRFEFSFVYETTA